MRKTLNMPLVVILTMVSVLAACRSLDNGGGKDWVQVEINLSEPGDSAGRSQSVSPSGTQAALITAIPASGTTIDGTSVLSIFYDRQLLNMTTDTVTLSVPLNEPLQLVKKTFSSDLALADAVTSNAFTAIGVSKSFIIDGSVTSKTVTISLKTTGGWSFVDGDGQTGINKDVTQAATAGQLAVYTSTLNGGAPSPTLFAGWTEESASNTTQQGYGQIRVAGWNGSSTWTFIDGDGAGGLNYDVTKLAENVNLTADDSKLYVSWVEYSDTTTDLRQLHIKSWDGHTWNWFEGNGDAGSAEGMNYNPTKSARSPDMAVFGSNLFVVWEEADSSGGFQIRGRKWDGSSWSFIDGGGATGLNQDVTHAARDPILVVFNSKLYGIWREQNANTGNPWQIRLAELDGVSGRTLKDSGVDAGLNYDTSQSVGESYFSLVFNSKLYITWNEPNASNVKQLRVVQWDGSAFSFVDGNGTNGLNRDVAKDAEMPTLVEYNSKLYLIWSEMNAAGSYQLRARQWDGGSSWTFVDGDGENGLNKVSTSWALVPYAVTFNSKLYLSFMEGLAALASDPSKPDQIRVLQYQ